MGKKRKKTNKKYREINLGIKQRNPLIDFFIFAPTVKYNLLGVVTSPFEAEQRNSTNSCYWNVNLFHLDRLKHKNFIGIHCTTLQHRAHNPFSVAILKKLG